MARRRKTEEQMDIFEEGGLKDEGGTIDPVSGNDVPPGSTQSEVRDDIPAQLSEGEFVFPADVVRYIGLENLMKLRQKAKMGLQKMEDMGQMGNSEEATMSDDGEFDAGVESMIEDMPMDRQMAQGGAVMSVEQEMMQKQRRGYAMGGAVMSVEQEMMQKNRQSFAPGGMPISNPLTPSQNIAPKVPTYAQFMGSPAGALGVKYASEQYIGPNGDIITVTTTNGRPNQPIPDGYRKYNPAVEAPKAPEVAKPKVEQSQEDSSDDRERAEEQKKSYRDWADTMATYAELSPEVAEQWAESPHNPESPNYSRFNIPANIASDYALSNAVRENIPDIAKEFGLDPADYENKFSFFGLDKYDEKRLADDIKSVKEDPNFKTKLDYQRGIDRGDYDVPGLTDAQIDAQIAEDLDEIADAIDRGDIGGNGPKGVSVELTSDRDSDSNNDTSVDVSDEDAESAAAAGAYGGMYKGGAVKTKRKKGLGRLK